MWWKPGQNPEPLPSSLKTIEEGVAYAGRTRVANLLIEIKHQHPHTARTCAVFAAMRLEDPGIGRYAGGEGGSGSVGCSLYGATALLWRNFKEQILGYVIRIYIKESGDSGNFVTQLTKLSPRLNTFISMQFSWQIMPAEGVSYLDRAAII